ncbi:NADH-quinone oxidoreductase subunit NuoD, partial [bacterium]|nr:NADH-quinone oxidoreductase subunit NuoD [bacterium]
PDPTLELVYHLCKSPGGSPLVLRVIVDRENPVAQSLALLFKGAEFQEREIWDLYGVRFSGHPDLRRILLWEGFDGHPLRKDWKEPFFEEESKPYKSRWPEGKIELIENNNPFGNNVQYPDGFTPKNWSAPTESALIDKMSTGELGAAFNTDELIINLGPQHPSTHGVFRMLTKTEGEQIISLKPVMGYLHRNHEKIGERNTFLQNMPYTDRLDYITSMSNNFGYALTVEKLMGITPPERAEYIRVMMAELTRIASHIMANGFLLNDLGAYFTPSLYSLEERELILDVFEAVSGSRMMCNYFRFGGVVRDIPADALTKIRDLVLNRLPRKIDELDRYLT